MIAIFLYIHFGLINQSISVYEIDEPARQLILIKTVSSTFGNLEQTILNLSEEFETKYINILNDKEFEQELINKHGLAKWEELF